MHANDTEGSDDKNADLLFIGCARKNKKFLFANVCHTRLDFFIVAVFATSDEVYERLAAVQAKISITDALNIVLQKDRILYPENEWTPMVFKLMKLMWHNRTDAQPSIGNSTCDIMMMEYDDWNEIDALNKRVIDECIGGRLTIDAIRIIDKDLFWIPQDLLTNPLRKFFFVNDLIKTAMAYNTTSWDDAGQRPAVEWLFNAMIDLKKHFFTTDDVKTILKTMEIFQRLFLTMKK